MAKLFFDGGEFDDAKAHMEQAKSHDGRFTQPRSLNGNAGSGLGPATQAGGCET